MTGSGKLKLVVLASGGGSNFQAIAEAINDNKINAHISAVITDVPQAHVIQRAADLGIESQVVGFAAFESRPDFDRSLFRAVAPHAPDLVVLAGYMRILDSGFVNEYADRLINIHPSLLPKYRGLHTHRRVLKDGAKTHGASVHFVVPELDAGPVIVQAQLAVNSDEDETMLAKRVLRLEHIIYPMAIQWVSEQRLSIVGKNVLLDGTRSSLQYLFEDDLPA